eukprot:jgi/Mesvir1/6824/Mv09009-RA.1
MRNASAVTRGNSSEALNSVGPVVGDAQRQLDNQLAVPQQGAQHCEQPRVGLRHQPQQGQHDLQQQQQGGQKLPDQPTQEERRPPRGPKDHYRPQYQPQYPSPHHQAPPQQPPWHPSRQPPPQQQQPQPQFRPPPPPSHREQFYQQQLEERKRYYQQQHAAMWQQQEQPPHFRQTPPPRQLAQGHTGASYPGHAMYPGHPGPREEPPSWQPRLISKAQSIYNAPSSNRPYSAGPPGGHGGAWQLDGFPQQGAEKGRAVRGGRLGGVEATRARPVSSRAQAAEPAAPESRPLARKSSQDRRTGDEEDSSSSVSESNEVAGADGVPQLVTRLTRKLQEDALECMICVDGVRRQAAIWSCTSCYNIFHLSCIVKWAKSVVAGSSSGSGDVLGASSSSGGRFFPSAAASVTIRLPNVGGGGATAGGGASDGNAATWRCPACQAIQTANPDNLRYLCLCRRMEDPPVDFYLTPHSCGELCGRERPAGCSHSCVLPCHPGPCPPCPALCGPRTCPCGKREYRPRCAQQGQVETCGAPCKRPLPCGRHACERPCHEGPCGACGVEMDASCFCGRQHKRETCGQLDVVGRPEEGAAAAAALDQHETENLERRHKRTDPAHGDREDGGGGREDGPDASRQGGDGGSSHVQPSHEPPSPRKIERAYGCGGKCNKPLSCGNHVCERECHPGECGPCVLAPGTVTACPCGRTKLADVPGHIPRASCLDPVPTCERLCRKLLPCLGGHSCAATCHGGTCPPCPLTVKRSCRCEAITKEVPCSSPAPSDIICDTPCGGKKSCRRHRCNERCCPARPRTGLPPSADADAHTCTLLCSKKLRCGRHPCTQLCHAGYCPPCLEAGMYELACLCGRTRLLPPIPCGSVLPVCGSLCPLARACGHPSNHTCHAATEPCPPCMSPVSAPCVGGHAVLHNIPCHTASSGSSVRCSATCGQMLPCGMHRCRRSCHPAPCIDIPGADAPAAVWVPSGSAAQAGAPTKRMPPAALSCQQKCGAERRDCGHPCAATCHPGQSCPTEPCREKVVIRCTCGRLSACVSCTAGRPSSTSLHAPSIKDPSTGIKDGTGDDSDENGAWGRLLYDIAAEIRALPTRLVDAVKLTPAKPSAHERHQPSAQEPNQSSSPPENPPQSPTHGSPPPSAKDTVAAQSWAAKDASSKGDGSSKASGGVDLDMGGAREEAWRILSARADPLGQRQLECDAECLKSEKRRLLAVAFGACQPLAPGEVGPDGLTETAHEALRRDLPWAVAIESRIAALCAPSAGRGLGGAMVGGGAKAAGGGGGMSLSRGSGGAVMGGGEAPRSRVHVFRPMNERERQAVHELAALWCVRSSSVGRDPYKLVTLWSIAGVSRPPPKGPVCRRLTPAGASMSFVLAAPEFDGRIDMDPQRVLSLPKLPPDCNVSSRLARFGTECDVVWLDDANAVAVFDCRQRAGSALRLLDHAVPYQGVCAPPPEAQVAEDRVWRGMLKSLGPSRGLDDVGAGSKPLVMAPPPAMIPVRNAWDVLADTANSHHGVAADARQRKGETPQSSVHGDALREGLCQDVRQADSQSALGPSSSKQAAATVEPKKGAGGSKRTCGAAACGPSTHTKIEIRAWWPDWGIMAGEDDGPPRQKSADSPRKRVIAGLAVGMIFMLALMEVFELREMDDVAKRELLLRQTMREVELPPATDLGRHRKKSEYLDLKRVVELEAPTEMPALQFMRMKTEAPPVEQEQAEWLRQGLTHKRASHVRPAIRLPERVHKGPVNPLENPEHKTWDTHIRKEKLQALQEAQREMNDQPDGAGPAIDPDGADTSTIVTSVHKPLSEEARKAHAEEESISKLAFKDLRSTLRAAGEAHRKGALPKNIMQRAQDPFLADGFYTEPRDIHWTASLPSRCLHLAMPHPTQEQLVGGSGEASGRSRTKSAMHAISSTLKAVQTIGFPCVFLSQECVKPGERTPITMDKYRFFHYDELPPIPRLKKGQYGYCAFVAGGQNLVEHPRNDEIDNHVTVIRMGYYVSRPAELEFFTDVDTDKLEPRQQTEPGRPLAYTPGGVKSGSGTKRSVTFLLDRVHISKDDPDISLALHEGPPDIYMVPEWSLRLLNGQIENRTAAVAVSGHGWQLVDDTANKMFRAAGIKGKPSQVFRTALLFYLSGMCTYMDVFGYDPTGRMAREQGAGHYPEDIPPAQAKMENLLLHGLMLASEGKLCIYN